MSDFGIFLALVACFPSFFEDVWACLAEYVLHRQTHTHTHKQTQTQPHTDTHIHTHTQRHTHTRVWQNEGEPVVQRAALQRMVWPVNAPFR